MGQDQVELNEKFYVLNFLRVKEENFQFYKKNYIIKKYFLNQNKIQISVSQQFWVKSI